MRFLGLYAALASLMIGGLLATLGARSAVAEPLVTIGTFSLDEVVLADPKGQTVRSCWDLAQNDAC